MNISTPVKAALAKQPKTLQKFAEIYFANAPKGMFEEADAKTVVSQVADSFKFFSQRGGNPIQIRVYTPLNSANTVVETLMTDQPFLVDTLWMALQRENHTIYHSLHPVIRTSRTKAGKLKDFGKKGFDCAESFIHVEISHTSQPARLQKKLEEALTQAMHAVEDFPAMLAKMQKLTSNRAENMPTTHDNLEQLAFLNWLTRGNYIYLGYRHYKINWKGEDATVSLHKGVNLGILRNDAESSVAQPTKLADMPQNLQWHYTNNNLLTITKSFTKSVVHRGVEMDYIGIKEFNKAGKVVGEHRFLGLFSSQAYSSHARQIPLINGKINDALKKLEHDRTTYRYKALKHILENYPKDELLQMSVKDATTLAEGILALQEQPQVKLITYRPKHERIISTLVFLPQDRMSSTRRVNIQKALMAAYQGEDMEWQVELGKGTLTRIFTKIRLPSAQPPKVDQKKLEAEIVALTQNWEDDLATQLQKSCGRQRTEHLLAYYGKAFSGAYTSHTTPAEAVDDIHALEKLRQSDSAFLTTIPRMEETHFILKLFHKNSQVDLSCIMPMFESLGLHITTEHPSKITGADGAKVWAHAFHVTLKPGQKMDAKVAETLVQAVSTIQEGEMELDCLNQLVMQGLSLEQILLLRAYSAYMHQTGRRYAKEYVRSTLVKHASLAHTLTSLFDARLNPTLSPSVAQKQEETCRSALKKGLNTVTVLDEDRIIQRFYDVLMATKRSNFWKRANLCAPLSFKIASGEIPGLVKPTPLYEIFVYHHTMEGVHLRGGMVARGGLRHSDRHSDYRTEVLGLMKAQMVKNAIIVPTGSKGGFVVKEPLPQDRDAYMQTVVKAYTIFIQHLLCLTDNLSAGKVVPPRKIKRLDGDDPYLVVAADKGTATFSDIANTIAITSDFWPNITNGFWLGDAFASGGSNGYDHKKMAITARGAWECVKHHFRNLGKDIQTEPFTVIGIGDMAGDVFGNGMLLSQKIQLVAAFNHLHIFIDPTPNETTSYKERKRLFTTPHSTWADYNKKLISKGGGVFERSAKSIPLSPQMKQLLGTNAKSLSPNEIIHNLLKAKVDLLWNGGIGTYIKAEFEDNIQVGDRANDEVRVNGQEIQAKVVGEGGNLGATQHGRVEYALNGGLINTDALDNSAGVDCSDNEVNIKILTTIALEKKKLSAKNRNSLLEKMTDDVANHVLQNNYLQALAITLKERHNAHGTDGTFRLIKALQNKGKLDPVVENLPDEEEMATRPSKAFTRPELCTLIAYAKYDLYDDLIESSFVNTPITQSYLTTYFPAEMQQKFSSLMPQHRLRPEIIATVLAGEVVNRMGMTFPNRLKQELGSTGEDVARAYLFAKNIFKADHLWQKIADLDNKVPAHIQMELYETVKDLLEHTAIWALHNLPQPIDVAAQCNRFSPLIEKMQVEKFLPRRSWAYFNQFAEDWQKRGLGTGTAQHFSLLPTQTYALEVANVALGTGLKPNEILPIYFEIGEHFGLDLLRNRLNTLPAENNWQRLAAASATSQLYAAQRRLVGAVVNAHPKGGKGATQKWLKTQEDKYKKYLSTLEEVRNTDQTTHEMISVALGHLG